MKTGTANLPLHYGKTPRWLFQRMTILAREVTIVIVGEFGPREMLSKLSDPFWFQALGCVLGFDWHSSGLTTTVCGALKEGIKGLERELGLFVGGGKGATSRRTPQEIESFGDALNVDPAILVYASRLAAKVDNTALQDGYQIYHHCFFFNRDGQWSVVQQGMNTTTRYARRYHWLSEGLEDFVCEPHSAVCCDQRGQWVLNTVAQESEEARQTMTEIAREKPEALLGDLKKLQTLELPARHPLGIEDINPRHLSKIMSVTYDRQPEGFETLLGIKGVGPKTIRALSLISELIYGAKPSFRDPARFSFAHGGKDGYPYPVDCTNYDRTIEALRRAIDAAKLGRREKLDAIKRLATFTRKREAF